MTDSVRRPCPNKTVVCPWWSPDDNKITMVEEAQIWAQKHFTKKSEYLDTNFGLATTFKVLIGKKCKILKM